MICVSIDDLIFLEIKEKREQLEMKILKAEKLINNIKCNGSKNNRAHPSLREKLK
jgi:hypothetical protein